MDRWIESLCYALLIAMTCALWVDGSLLMRLHARALEGVHTEVLIDKLEIDFTSALPTSKAS